MSKITREEALSKKIIDQTILEMEASLGESEDVIRYIIEEATKEISSIKGDEPYKLDDYDLKKFAFGMIKQCTNFISTMDYTKLLKQPQLNDDVEEALMYVIDGLKCNAQWSIYEPFINTIKQHIQSQASENKELKQRCANFMKQTNAIREVCENEEELVIKKSENAYKDGRNSMRREIKRIIEEQEQ